MALQARLAITGRVQGVGYRDWAVATGQRLGLSGWVRNLIGVYNAREEVHYDKLKNVPRWLDRCLERPAVQRGLTIPSRD